MESGELLLQDKVAMITGAAVGIGESVARLFAGRMLSAVEATKAFGEMTGALEGLASK